MPQNSTRYCAARDPEEAEDHRDDEDVVHRERLLDDEAGQVFLRGLRADHPPDEAAEQHAEGDVEGRQRERLPHPDLLLGIPVQHPEVEGQEDEDERVEGEPQPDGLAEPVDEQERGEKFHRNLQVPGRRAGAGQVKDPTSQPTPWLPEGPGSGTSGEVGSRGPRRKGAAADFG
jgi:hypothetical protein